MEELYRFHLRPRAAYETCIEHVGSHLRLLRFGVMINCSLKPLVSEMTSPCAWVELLNSYRNMWPTTGL